jgi:hypothetical protein
LLAIPGLRVFSLASNGDLCGISCDSNGLFVGPVALLKRVRKGDDIEQWTIRPEAELNEDLTLLYHVPIDISSKIGGATTIARALSQGNLALAKIAAVQLQFPNPPPMAKGIASPDEEEKLASELYWSGLFKGDDWDPDKHPRTGTKPYPNRFAEVPKEPKLPAKPGWPLPTVNRKARTWVATAEEIIAKTGRLVIRGVPLFDAITAFADAFSPTELNQGEDRLVAQMKANFDPPKTFEELQKPPTDNILGYERHHIVEQNPANLEKDEDAAVVDAGRLRAKHNLVKFGREKLEDPSNIVWVPRLKHEKITNDYNSTDDEDPQERLRRDVVNKMDFEKQREEG